MTCSGCQAKVASLLSAVDGITAVRIDLAREEASLDMQKHVSTRTLQEALKDHPKYKLSDIDYGLQAPAVADDAPGSWLTTYRPVLLVFAYVIAITLIETLNTGPFQWKTAMRIFMSGFFLSFSFFKMLDLRGFADSYSTYDIVAKRFWAWGIIYAFIELGLGLSYAMNFQPFLINGIAFVVMTVSLIGVMQAVLSKKKIRCACLGTGFNLPMTTVTIIEDALMIAMSALMLLSMY
jgi:copper chaperone CopZ